MEKKSKAGLVVVTVILGILCAGMIAACVLLFLNCSVGALNQKAREDKNDFKETEVRDGDYEYEGVGENFEVVINEAAPIEEEPEAGQEEASEYLCPESDQRQLTEEDVAALQNMTVEGLPEGKTIIQMVINEMYARRGYQFMDQAIQDYFNSKAWYQEITERTEDMDAIYQNMTDVEKANVEFLQAYEQ